METKTRIPIQFRVETAPEKTQGEMFRGLMKSGSATISMFDGDFDLENETSFKRI
jgi:hypothetical protein